MVLAPPGDRLRAFGLELRAGTGEVVLVMHGDRDGFLYPGTDGDVRVTVAQVADLLAELLPPAPDRTQLTVCACSLATVPTGGMRELSVLTGRPVVAPTSDVWVHRPGRAGARVSTTGGWMRVDGLTPPVPSAAPQALVAPRTVPGAQRVGPPGVALPIAPRAPPVQAGAYGDGGHVDGDSLASAELRAFAVARVAVHGGDTLAKSRRHRAGFASYEFVKETGWTGALMGDLVEELGLPYLESIVEPGERVLANVTLIAIGDKGQRREFDELDLLVVGADGVVSRYVSAKANPRNFKMKKDRKKVTDLFRDVPTHSLADLRTWLAANTQLKAGEIATTSRSRWRTGPAARRGW